MAFSYGTKLLRPRRTLLLGGLRPKSKSVSLSELFQQFGLTENCTSEQLRQASVNGLVHVYMVCVVSRCLHTCVVSMNAAFCAVWASLRYSTYIRICAPRPLMYMYMYVTPCLSFVCAGARLAGAQTPRWQRQDCWTRCEISSAAKLCAESDCGEPKKRFRFWWKYVHVQFVFVYNRLVLFAQKQFT